MVRFIIILVFLTISFGLQSQDTCYETVILSSISDFRGGPQGVSTYDEIDQKLYSPVSVSVGFDPVSGEEIFDDLLAIVNSETGVIELTERPPFGDFEIGEGSDILYGIKSEGGAFYFSRYNINTGVTDNLSTLSDFCGSPQGITTIDQVNGIYYSIYSSGIDCNNGPIVNVLSGFDIQTGSLIYNFELTEQFTNIEYDPMNNRLVGLSNSDGFSYLAELELAIGTVNLLFPIEGLISWPQGISGYDYINGNYLLRGDKGIGEFDPNDPITEPKLYVINATTGLVINSEVIFFNEFEYDGTFNEFVGIDGSGEVIRLDISNCKEKYELTDVVISCNQTTFNSPLNTNAEAVSNIIGYDITVVYDPTVLTPTGNLTIPADLINPSYVSALLSDNNGEILISLALNGSAPNGTTWSGTGELFQIEFENTGGLSDGSTHLEITRMEESYIVGTEQQQVSPGIITVEGDQLFEAVLVEASSGDPIKNDVPTVISGKDSNCIDLGTITTNPAADGSFAIDVSLASSISIIRDINNATDMMPVIGGDDALTLQKVLVNHPDIVTTPPTITQLMAMDVNMDGRVTSGDLTQVNQRTVGSLDEFRQAWNYDNAGVSNGTASLDWGFVDQLSLTETAYIISSNFPDDDGLGYSKTNVPIFDLCHEIPISEDVSCPEITDTQFVGVLLGDVNGTVASKLGEGNFRTESLNEVVINLENAELTSEGNLAVPVVVIGENVQNLDLNFRFDNEVLQYDQVGKLSHESLQYLDHLKTAQELRLTSYSLQTYSAEKPSFFLEFKTNEKKITSSSFGTAKAFANGEVTTVKIEGKAQIDKLKNQLDKSFSNRISLFPNPINEILTVSFQDNLKGNVSMHLYNVFGQEVLLEEYNKTSSSFGVNIDLSSLKKGVYIIEIQFENQYSKRRIVKK